MKKKTKKKVYTYVDSDSTGRFKVKPSRNERPVCLNCKRSMPIRRAYWYVDEFGAWRRTEESDGPMYLYDGISYFCCRNCSMNYAWKAARKELKIKPINKIQ